MRTDRLGKEVTGQKLSSELFGQDVSGENRKRELSYYAPVGMELKQEKTVFIVGMIMSSVFSFWVFGIVFSDCLEKLYWKNGAQRTVIPGAMMTNFTEIIGEAFFGFKVVAALMIATAVIHYLYHFQESKSIYTMRRLPSVWELHRRCLTLPICGIVISMVTAFLILLICYGFYVGLTPKECMLPGQWQKIWQWML